MSITKNRKAFHDYFIDDQFEAGIVLEGWEVKAIRAGQIQINEAYVRPISGEIFLIGSHITPLDNASTHILPDPTRSRKLLLNKLEIKKLVGKVERAGNTMVPLDMHFSKGKVKLQLGLARGKKQFDKRQTIKERDWQREQSRLLKKIR